MSDSFQASCPQCGATLTVNDRSLVGRKVACGTCGTTFTLTSLRRPSVRRVSPEEERQSRPRRPVSQSVEYDYEDYGDDAYGYEDDPYGFQPAPRPVRRRPSASPKRKKRPSRHRSRREMSRGLKIGLIIGGSALGLVVLILCAGGIGRLFSIGTQEMDEPLAYLTIDSEMVFVIRLDDMRKNPQLAREVERDFGREQIKKLLEVGGLEVDDLVTYARGLPESRDDGNPQALLQSGGVAIIEASKPWKRSAFARQATKAEHAGKEYLKARSKTSGVVLAIFFANENTIVIASEETIKRVLAVENPTISKSRFAFADFESSIAVAFVAKPGTSVPHDSIMIESLRNDATAAAHTLVEPLKAIQVCRDIGQNCTARIEAVCADVETARRLAAEISQSSQMKDDLAQHLIPAIWEGRPDIMRDSRRNLKTELKGTSVIVSTRFVPPG